MDLNLSPFGKCNYISGHHSTIFYDEVRNFSLFRLPLKLNVHFSESREQMSRHFELLNYSEHGTVVDNVVYCCDFDMEEHGKSEAEDVREKEKKQSFHGLDDLFRRNGDKMTGSTAFLDSNEVLSYSG